MKKSNNNTKPVSGNDHSKPDSDADHSGTDLKSDTTKLIQDIRDGRYDKPSREVNPDTTGIDTKADKTKINHNEKK